MILVFGAVLATGLGCSRGASEEEVQRRVDDGVATALAAIPPTPTPQPTATPRPTAVPASPHPSPTQEPQRSPVTAPVSSASSPTPQPVAYMADIYAETNESVFMTDAEDQTGSAFLIEPGLLLTSAHVLDGQSTVLLRRTEGQPIEAEVIATDPPRDLALLSVEEGALEAEPLELAETVDNRSIAQPLIALGYSNAEPLEDGSVGPVGANFGVLTRVATISDEMGLGIEMDAPIDPGDSGGPVIDRSGKVIGVSRAVVISTSDGQRVVGTFLAIAADTARDSVSRMLESAGS